MDNKLSQKFNTVTLLKFTTPTTIMLMFMSLYQMVDGIFVANLVGEDALSALNIVYPIPSIVIAVSIMLATGGSAIIARNMGEGKSREAKENFSLLMVAGLVFGILFMLVFSIFIEPIIYLLGATRELYPYCHDYLLILVLTAPMAVFQMLFQSYFVTAGKPMLGLTLTIIGGCTNIVLDYVFIGILKLGVSGAATATAIGYTIPAVYGVVYFAVNRRGTLYFVRPVFRKRVLLLSSANGSSEMVNNLAIAITTFIYNTLMLKYAGKAGVASITVVLYAQFLMTSALIGFSSGVAPVISYNYGRQNHTELQKLFKMCIRIVIVFSVLIFAFARVGSTAVVEVFVSRESEVFQMTKDGFGLFSISFLFTGINIFASSMFTAFSDGKVSAIISFLRTFVFLVICLLVLPLFMGIDGIWLAVPVAEILTVVISIGYFVKLRKKYHYCK